MSNAEGRLDGLEKSLRHTELCSFYVGAVHGIHPDLAINYYPGEFERLHDATQELTSCMDEQIGFPLVGEPDYDRLCPLFFNRFHDLAMAVLMRNFDTK
jgi:hypothetical protein